MSSLYKRHGIYYIATMVNGKRVYRSTKTRTKPKALAFLTAGFTELTQGPPRKKGLTYSAFLTDFLEFSGSNHAPSTLQENKRVAKLFEAFLGDDRLLRLVKPLDIERFKSLRLRSIKAFKNPVLMVPLSPSSVNIELRSIKAMFGHAVRWGLLEKNPCVNVPLVRIPERPPEYLTEVQVQTLLAKIEDPRFRMLILFAIHTGLRRGEIVNLKWRDVDLVQRVVTVTSSPTFKTKTGRMYRTPMNEVVYRLLSAITPESEYVFVTDKGMPFDANFVTHKLKDCARDAGLPDFVHFHSLRHTFASLLARAGVPLYDIQKLLNHRSITTTQAYSHLVTDDLRKSVERLVSSRN